MRKHVWTDNDYDGLRAFIHLYRDPRPEDNDEVGPEIGGGHVELSTNQHGFCHAYVQVNGEEDVLLSVAVPKLFAVWVGVELKRLGFGWDSVNPLRRLFIQGKPVHAGGTGIEYGPLGFEEREFGVKVQGGKLVMEIGTTPHGGSSNRLFHRRRAPWEWLREVGRDGVLKRPEYRRNVERRTLYGRWLRLLGLLPEYGFEIRVPLDPRDLLLGPDRQIESKDVTFDRYQRHRNYVAGHGIPEQDGWTCAVRVMIPMPEGDYEGLARIHRTVFGRKRWRPGHRVSYHTDLDVEGGIPFPGKGTESYNCGDDALCSQTTPGDDVQEAAAKLIASVMGYRARYGGSVSWRPPVSVGKVPG